MSEDRATFGAYGAYDHTGQANIYSQRTVATPPGYITFTVSLAWCWYQRVNMPRRKKSRLQMSEEAKRKLKESGLPSHLLFLLDH